MIEAFQNAVLIGGLAILGVIACVALAAPLRRALGKVRNLGWGFGLLCIGLVFYAGAKHGSLTFDSTYLRDTGSYLSNDVVHISIAKRTELLPDGTTILVYAKHYTQSNSTDWAILDDSHSLMDYPLDFELANATNYDVAVYADFTPAPTVHTNGVWQMRGFTIPASGGGRHAFPNTRTIRKEDAND